MRAMASTKINALFLISKQPYCDYNYIHKTFDGYWTLERILILHTLMEVSKFSSLSLTNKYKWLLNSFDPICVAELRNLLHPVVNLVPRRIAKICVVLSATLVYIGEHNSRGQKVSRFLWRAPILICSARKKGSSAKQLTHSRAFFVHCLKEIL